MQRYRSSGQSSSDAACAIRIIVSFVMILISIAAIFIVFTKVSEIKILEKISLKEEPHNGINITTDTAASTSMFITDEKGLKFRKEDKSFAREEWIDKNGELFYFDTAGYGITDDLKKDGQVYTFENGKLKSIKRDTSYVTRADENLYSSVESAQFLVWLAEDEKEKSFYPIKYKQYSDYFEDYLGTANDKQYASPNMIKINMSNIYYLAVGKGTEYAGRLYRMRPGAVHKETVGVGVTGFIVLSDDVVYYYDGERIIKAKSWKGVEINALDEEELALSEALSNVPDATKSEIIKDDKIDDTKKDETKKEEIPILDLPVPDKVETKETTAINEDKMKKETTKKVVKEGVVEVGKGPVAVEVDAPR